MSKVRIKLNHDAIAEFLRSDDVRLELERRAQAIANAAGGEGFEVESRVGAKRVRTSVRTATLEARMAEAEERALTSALEAGRA